MSNRRSRARASSRPRGTRPIDPPGSSGTRPAPLRALAGRLLTVFFGLSLVLYGGCSNGPENLGSPGAGPCRGTMCPDADSQDAGRGSSRDAIDDLGAQADGADGDADGAFDDGSDDSDGASDSLTPPTDTGPPAVDSDRDGITDRIEGEEDFDEDGIPNHLDLDSDGDGIPDETEYRRAARSDLQPSDLDGDGDPDFLDLDSDGDGLLDENETGCPESTYAIDDDSDDDGFIDMLEVAFGSDPCDPGSDIEEFVDFFFELPYLEPEQTAELDISTTLESGDVAFDMDVTGSMSGAIDSLKNSLRTTIIPTLAERIADIGIGVAQFADFPCDAFGSVGDLPFALRQRVTTDRAAAQAAVASLHAAGGGDGPESGIEALYQIATGEGRTSECTAGNIDPFDPTADEVVDIADGTIGGAGFRDSEVRIVVQISDASTHANGESSYPFGATRDEAYDALAEIDARVIGLAVGVNILFGFESAAEDDLREAANRTGAVVPPCAWGEAGDRPAGCSRTQCCTGVDGAGLASAAGGLCPLVFQVETGFFGGGGGVDTSIISGIAALLGGEAFEITAVLRRDDDEFAASGIDTTCFINGVVPVAATPAGCAEEPLPADTDGDGELDGFTGVAPGSSVTFEIRAENDCVEETVAPQVFFAFIDLITSDGASLGTRVVTILVPPEDPKG